MFQIPKLLIAKQYSHIEPETGRRVFYTVLNSPHDKTLLTTQDTANEVRSQVETMQYRTYKHTLFGLQEGKCNGCQVLFPFCNMTVNHIVAKSKGGADTPDNLQLLCGACNSMKGNRTQKQLIQKLKNKGVLE